MMKVSDIGRFLLGLLILAVIGAVVLWRVAGHGPAHPKVPAPPTPVASIAYGCDDGGWEAAAAANSASLDTLGWRPFGRPETGWATYAPLIAREVGTACGPKSTAFASSLAVWQHRHHRPENGVFGPDDFDVMRDAMNLRRPFVQQTAQGLCPAAPADSALAQATPAETLWSKPIQLREGALAAYRRMAAAAKAAGVAQGQVLKLVSGYRGPSEEAARCEDGGCNTLTRAHCSAHRTGLALDLYLDHAAGQDPTSTDDANRAAMARTPAYRWLAAHAGEFGFLPYPFEPWHWEWTGEPP